MNIDTNKYYNYRQMMMGKTVDHDGAYDCQCWDGYMDYCQYNGFKGANCTIKIRKAPSLSGVDTGLYYKQGMHVNYDGYVKREGCCWISWISASTGERRWMACGELNQNGYNTSPYGVFK